MEERILIYKYFCINDECPETPRQDVHIRKSTELENREELCEYCGQALKQLGILTNISHIGTQEAMNKMRR